MTDLRFTITFHGPFRVATGQAGAGFDTMVDEVSPIPAPTLKGFMRAAARGLSIANPSINAVFGRSPQPSPWAWSDADMSEGFSVDAAPRVRVKIDAETGTAVEDHLQYGQIAWASSATFVISSHYRIPDAERTRHSLILRASAASVHALGNQRRRGLGWVHISPDQPLTIDDVRELRALQEVRP
ncbi:RAMP superfamily CRISPR-associated protein [Phytoactinopolyspora limicola]|uniref:RAMP superfamily CRISPR-associated protein n=1 Tax=Phytoactinopolyspora limicola TaxID=2715536 RepID=UPI00140CAC37|nr:RAMP superfamily CRISPR-associated protein [Phytoactinopolyspora limicola]